MPSTIKAVRFTVSSDNTCGFTQQVNHHNPNHLDPLLTALGSYGGPTQVHMLKHNSPVLDGVIGNGLSTTDQRGKPRPGVGTLGWDPGAVERQSTDSTWPPGSGYPWCGGSWSD